MKTISLCMIAKNESKVILRCLESVRPIVDYVLVEDTGSTDGTQAIIRDWLGSVGLSGQVYDEPWRDFAYNRSHVLAKLRKNKNVDYAFMLDADDHIVLDANFDIASFKNSLSLDLYDVELRSGPASYLRPQICSNRREFRYRGVLHEFLQEPRGRATRGRTNGFYITSTREGARSQDPEKYHKDAALLEEALRTERDEFLRSRYTFYMARSYENAGDKELALKAFLKRATLGHWTEEIFMSLYSAGHLEEQLGRPVEEVIARFMQASKVAPARAEALHAASRVCRENKRFAEGYDYARRGLAIPLPANGLFVVPWIYDYGLLDEFAINAYGSEHHEDCLEACERLLQEGKIPAEMRERVENNARFAREKLTSPRVEMKKEGPKTIGLCMIVKNESHIILRCLESVLRLLDYVLVEDTGSTDGTQAIILEWLDRVGLPGEVYDEPWQDFAYNRSHALARLRQRKELDYAVIMDADDIMVFDDGFDPAAFKATLSQDMYDVDFRGGTTRYRRAQICSNRLEFRYRGVLHEFLQEPSGVLISRGTTNGFYISSTRGGARSRDPETYRKDAAVLVNALQVETDPFLRSRYTFYLAQSYRDAGEKARALETFLKRAELGYWTDEIFMSLYTAGQLQQSLGRPVEEVIATFMRASDAAPTRAEALHAASRLCRENKKFADGYEYARRGLAIAQPADGLFVASWIYDYGLLDELAVNAYWAARYQDSLDACQRLLTEGKMPADMYQRVRKNADSARDNLGSRAPPTPELPTTGKLQVIEQEPTLARLKLILICGPWGSGTSAIAGMLERMGTFGVGPYFQTNDPATPNSYESIPFSETIRYALGYTSQRTFPFAASSPTAVQCGLRLLQKRIEQQEFGPYDLHFPKPIFAKYPLSALVISQICEVFDTKLIYVMRSLEDIERTRLRRNWPAYYGAEGASMIYGHMSTALKDREKQTMTIDYKQLLASPMVYVRDIARFVGLELSAEELRRATDFIKKPAALSPISKETPRDEAPERASGDDPELAFVSLYHAADALRTMGRPFEEVIAAYDRASDAAPHRAEGIHDASRLCRWNNKFAEGYEYAQRGLAITPPTNGLSIQQWIYDYGLLDEFAVNAYWIERYDDCLEACERLLREGKILPEMRERVENNARFARKNLTKKESTKAVDSIGGGADEVFVSLQGEAERLRVAGRPFDEVIAAYDRASNAAPYRAEALHDASRFCRWNNRFAEGYEYARRGLMITPPVDGLSVQQWIYEYGLLDELAVSAYWVERYQVCLDACERLLREGKIPPDMRDRVKKNAEFAAAKIQLMSPSAAVSTKPRKISSAPKYSIITPTRCRENMLRLQHQGILEQTEGDFEWLILDDSPGPSTYFSTLTDDRIHYRHIANRLSIGAKRNLLNEQARGDIILHFDDDDYYSKDYLAAMVRCFDGSMDVVKLSGWYVYSRVYRELGYWDLTQKLGLHLCWSKEPMGSAVFGDDYSKGNGANSLLGFGFCYAYRRDSWKKVQFPDRDFGEDGEFIRSILSAGGQLHQFADTAGICVHILHNSNTSLCYPQYRLPPFMIDRLVPAWAIEILNGPETLRSS
jgi:glycosyltransferase involved in cell wall biosynthesis